MACGKNNCWTTPEFIETRWLPPGSAWRSFLRPFEVWLVRIRDRRALGMLTDSQLMDVGLSRNDVLVEMRKPFWRR